MTYLHQCKPDPIIHCDLKPKNIFLDSGGQLKIAGFGVTRVSKVGADKVKLINHEALVDSFSYHTAPELYRNEAFDSSVDAYSFGFILYEVSKFLFQIKNNDDDKKKTSDAYSHSFFVV